MVASTNGDHIQGTGSEPLHNRSKGRGNEEDETGTTGDEEYLNAGAGSIQRTRGGEKKNGTRGGGKNCDSCGSKGGGKGGRDGCGGQRNKGEGKEEENEEQEGYDSKESVGIARNLDKEMAMLAGKKRRSGELTKTTKATPTALRPSS